MARVLYMLNKPFGILSQHSDEGAKSGWGRLNPPFGSDVYSIGRLDADSEGLLLFTNDNAFKTRMLDGKWPHQNVPCASGGRANFRTVAST